MFAYNVCDISEADSRRSTQMQRELLQAARAVIEASPPVERVVLLQAQIFALDEEFEPLDRDATAQMKPPVSETLRVLTRFAV